MQAISKKAKKLYWRELVAMTAEPGWDANPAICQRVEAINKITSSEHLSESRPLGNIDYYRFTPGNFLYLKFLGYQIREIQEACGVSKTTFGKFLADFELTRDFYSNTRINQMKFTKSDMTIPQWDGKFREVADSKNDDDPGLIVKQWDEAENKSGSGKAAAVEYAVYRGEVFLCVGTAVECGDRLSVLPETIKWMASPSGRRRFMSRKDQSKVMTAVKIEESDP